MDSCLNNDAIKAFVTGEISAEFKERLEAHLAMCSDCRKAVEVRRTDTRLAGDIRQAYEAATLPQSMPPVAAALANTPPVPESIEGYDIQREIHRGGQGVVYKAVQQATKRTVALKVLLQGPYASAEQRHRFEREIDLVASLQHPNIVTIYDSGVTQGRHYFAMEYIHGQSLDAYSSNTNLNIDETLRLFAKICSAVNYAHQRGVIHRDLKPGNIRIDANGEPHVLDFGLAKAAGPDLQSGAPVTVTGEFMGTLAYASPEQTKGDPSLIDIRTDVYSLGVVLYEMLTGKYPYQVVGQMAEVLRNIAEAEPNKPSTIRRKINDEVETIVLKALAKERERRYQSAENLARDIEHYLSGEPIDAKRDSGLYVLKKQLKRYWLPVTIAAAFTLLVISSTIGLWFLWDRAEEQTAIAETKTEEANKAADLAEERAEENRRLADSESQARMKADERAESLRRSLYSGSIALTENAFNVGEIGRMREKLNECPPDLRGWEWHRLNYISDPSTLTLRGHEGWVSSVAFSPDGTRIVSAAGSLDETVRLWDAATGENILTLRGHEDVISSVAFSPDGTRIVSGSDDKTVKVWNAIMGDNTLTLRGHEDAVSSVAFSPDGTRIVSGSDDKTVKVWDATTGENIMTLRGHDYIVLSVAFGPEGARIVSGSRDKTAKLWNAATGENTLTLRGHQNSVFSAAFSPDGTRIASGSRDKTVKVWDAATGENILTLRGHKYSVRSVAFGPKGARIVSGSTDKATKLWDVATGENIMTVRGHEDSVSSVAFSPDGTRIVSGSWDHTVKLWDANRGENTLTQRGHEDVVSSVALSPDGTRIVSGSWDRTARLWDTSTGENILTLRGHEGCVQSAAFSPDGTRIASGSSDNTVKLWDAAAGANTLTLRGHEDPVWSVAFSQDGTRIVSGSFDSTVKLWDAATGANTMTMRGHENCVFSVAFSPDSTRFVSGSADETVKLWDAVTGENILTLRGHEGVVCSVAFSPDGTRIVSGSWDRTAKLWDVATGENTLTLRGHEGWVQSAAFSPDGTRITSGSSDATVKVWDVATGENILTLRGHMGGVYSLAFSPDGTRIVSGSGDKTVKVWETATPSRAVLVARQAIVASHRRVEWLKKRFPVVRQDGFDSMKMGEVSAACEQFQEAHDIAARLIEAEPNNARYQVMLAQTCSHLSRVAIRQGNGTENRQWALKLIHAQRRLAGLPGVGASTLNAYARDLLTCEPAEMRNPVAALPVAQKALEKSDGKDPNILDTLALAYFLTGDIAKAIKTEENALSLLPPGDSESRTELEASLARFRRAATSQSTTTQPVE